MNGAFFIFHVIQFLLSDHCPIPESQAVKETQACCTRRVTKTPACHNSKIPCSDASTGIPPKYKHKKQNFAAKIGPSLIPFHPSVSSSSLPRVSCPSYMTVALTPLARRRLLLGFVAGGSGLPVVADLAGDGDEVLLADAVLDALQDAHDGGRVVGLVLVVAEADDVPDALLVAEALDDAVVEGVVEALERLPLVLGDVDVGEALVLVGARVALVDEDLGAGHVVVVDPGLGDALGAVLVVGLDPVLEEQPEAAVDGVLLRGLPLKNVGVGAGLVGRVAAGEDEAVVAVRQVGEDLPEHHLDAVAELEGLHLDEEGLELPLLGELLEQLLVGVEEARLDVRDPLVQRPVHEAVAGQDEAVEDEEPGLDPAVGQRVPHQLTVGDCVFKVGGSVFGMWEVQVAVVEEPVVVLTIDEVVRLGPIVVGRRVQQVADAVRLFADVVARKVNGLVIVKAGRQEMGSTRSKTRTR